MRLAKIAMLILIEYFLMLSCNPTENYRKDLLSDNKTKIDKACYALGEAKDTSAVKFLLTKILDPRISNDLRFKGMSVNYCRLIALKKISGIGTGKEIDRFGPDTLATFFYLDWAIKLGHLKSKTDVDIYYFK